MGFETIKNTILKKIEYTQEYYVIADLTAINYAGYKLDKNKVIKTDGNDVKTRVEEGTIFGVDYTKEKDGFNVRKDAGKGIVKIHPGVDLSYGKDSIYTYCHPIVYSPVTGIIEELESLPERNRVVIKSSKNKKQYYHILEHLDTIEQYLKVGNMISAGKPIGRMGGRGLTGAYHYNQHVHYEIMMHISQFTINKIENNLEEEIEHKITSKENLMYLDPEEFWNGKEKGFIKSSETGIKMGKAKNSVIKVKREIKVTRKETVTKDNGHIYQFGEIEFNGKKWQSIEKKPIGEITYQSLYEENNKKNESNQENVFFPDFDNRIKLSEYQLMWITNMDLMQYGVKEGVYSSRVEMEEIVVDGIKPIDIRIMTAETTKVFEDEKISKYKSDILICKSVVGKEYVDNKKFAYYELVKSKEAYKELIEEIENSLGKDDKLELSVRVKTNDVNDDGNNSLEELGIVSSTYESNGNPATISSGKGDRGGKSYGAWQFAGNLSVPQSFVRWLKNENIEFYTKLSNALELDKNKLGENFNIAWKDLGNNRRKEFWELQHKYVKSKYYDIAVNNVLRYLNYDVSQKSFAMKNVLWSCAVQHGPGGLDKKTQKYNGAVNLFSKANLNLNEEDIITSIYEERSKVDIYFSGSSEAVKKGVKARFIKEKKDALKMLEKEKK